MIDRVLRRPALSAALSAGLLVALALPAFGLHVSKPSDNALSSQSEPEVATFARIRAAFPGTSEPAIVVVAGPPSQRAAADHALGRLESLAVTRRVAHRPFTVSTNADRTAASLELPLIGAGDNAASKRSLGILRRQLVPATLEKVPGIEVAVTGATAEDVDFTRQMKHGVPYMIVFVLVFAFLLLLVAFRSIVVPLKAIVLNLLSVGASYGVLVLVFQHHWAESLLGFKSNGAIISWLPLFLFVVLFGLQKMPSSINAEPPVLEAFA
jgi:RND superfamily putative drug exporter